MERLAHWIGGRRREQSDGRSGPVFDPSTGEQRANVPLAAADVVDEAVNSARKALDTWQDTSLTARQRILFAYRELLVEHRDNLARLITKEHGKTLDDARGEVQRGLEVVEFACGLPHLVKGEFSEHVSTDVDTFSIRQPLGVVAGVTPFNFPVMVPMWMFPLAIACGNTFVLKPSEKDPSSSVLAAELFSEAGLPDGVLNVVHGDREAVDRLLEHDDIRAISFVGSTPVARAIYRRASDAGKRVQALGGAKNHMVVLPDADMDEAADAAASAGYGSAGERCMAISVVVAVGRAGQELVPRLADRAGGLRVGPGAQPGVEMGPLITGQHRDRVTRYIEHGPEEGAELIVDGRGLEVENHQGGFWVGPTLFDHVTPEMNLYRDEIFGPVLSVIRVDTLNDALDLIARNPYGNGTALFTRDGAAARSFQRHVEAGMVGINVPIPVPMSFYSFGGWGESMFGGFDIYGPDGIRFYTRQKSVTARWQAPAKGLEFGFPTSD